MILTVMRSLVVAKVGLAHSVRSVSKVLRRRRTSTHRPNGLIYGLVGGVQASQKFDQYAPMDL